MIIVQTTTHMASSEHFVVLEESKDPRTGQHFYSVYVRAHRPNTKRSVKLLQDTMIEDKDVARELANRKWTAIAKDGSRP